MLRATLDVNVLVEGTISSRGPAGAILAAWEEGQVEVVICEEIIAEFEDVLNRPRIRGRYAGLTAPTIAAAVAALRQNATDVLVNDIPSVIRDDPDDDVVLACAIAGNADYIVSRDQHLLRHATVARIPIVPPESFLLIVREHRRTVVP